MLVILKSSFEIRNSDVLSALRAPHPSPRDTFSRGEKGDRDAKMPTHDSPRHRPPDQRTGQNIGREMRAVIHARHGHARSHRVDDRRHDPVVVVAGDSRRERERVRRMP